MTAVASAPPRADAQLDVGIDTLGLALSGAQRERIRAYLALLDKWNRSYNLTAIREPEKMITHHALDALAVLPRLPDDEAPLRVLDVGSGGGVPGVLLAIARPHWQVTLLDANHKKGAFLTQAVIELALANATVAVSRVEDYTPPARFDIVISRAYATLAEFVAGAGRHASPQGKLYAMKGVMPEEEIAALSPPAQVEARHALDVPGLDAARSLVVIDVR